VSRHCPALLALRTLGPGMFEHSRPAARPQR
jgi:hypothetical protein